MEREAEKQKEVVKEVLEEAKRDAARAYFPENMRDIRETGYDRSNDPPAYESLRDQNWRRNSREIIRSAPKRSILRNDEEISRIINVSEDNEIRPNNLRETKVRTWVKCLRQDGQTVDIRVMNIKADNDGMRQFAATFGNAVQDYLEDRGCEDIMLDYVHVNHNQNWLKPVNVFIAFHKKSTTHDYMLGRLNRVFFRGLPIYTEPAIRPGTCCNPTFTMTEQKRYTVGRVDKIMENAQVCADESEEFDKDNDLNSTIVNESEYEDLVIVPTARLSVQTEKRDNELLRERDAEIAELKSQRDQLAEQLAELTQKYEEIRDAYVTLSLSMAQRPSTSRQASASSNPIPKSSFGRGWNPKK